MTLAAFLSVVQQMYSKRKGLRWEQLLHTLTHVHIHTCTHTHTHMYTRTHTHMYTDILSRGYSQLQVWVLLMLLLLNLSQ